MKSCLLGLVLLTLPAAAQEQKQHFTINVSTPEGQMLQAIGQESDDDKKLALAQDFLDKYPKHEGAGWVTGQLEVIYVKQKEYDKALEVGDKGHSQQPQRSGCRLQQPEGGGGQGGRRTGKNLVGANLGDSAQDHRVLKSARRR